MKTSICIVNYNSTPLVDACLASIHRFPPADPFEVIVVDNASTDPATRLGPAYPGVRFLQNRENVGYAAANNQGLREGRGEFFFLLNPDTELREGTVDALVACLESRPDAGLASARLVDPDGTPQTGFMVRRLPTLAATAAQLLLLDELWPGNPVTARAACRDLDYTRVQEVEQPAASALLIRRSVWESLHGFDEAFTNWFNDVDLCMRVHRAGWKALFCPDAVVVHHGGMGAASLAVEHGLIQYYRAMRLYFLRHRGISSYVLVTLFVAVGMALRTAVVVVLPVVGRSVFTRGDRRRGIARAFAAVFADTFRSVFRSRAPGRGAPR